MSPIVWAGLGLLLSGTGLYVAAEFAAVGVRKSKIRRLAEDGNLLAQRLLPYIENPTALDRYVGASQIGITLTSLGLGALAQATVTVWLTAIVASYTGWEPRTAFSATAVTVLTVLTGAQLILGEKNMSDIPRLYSDPAQKFPFDFLRPQYLKLAYAYYRQTDKR